MVGLNIKKIRVSAGLTQLQLAKKVGVSEPMICQIERGTKMPTVILAKEIADALNVNINKLLE